MLKAISTKKFVTANLTIPAREVVKAHSENLTQIMVAL